MARKPNQQQPQQPPEPTVVEEPKVEEVPVEAKPTPEQIMQFALQRRKEIKGKFAKPEEGKSNWRPMTPKN